MRNTCLPAYLSMYAGLKCCLIPALDAPSSYNITNRWFLSLSAAASSMKPNSAAIVSLVLITVVTLQWGLL